LMPSPTSYPSTERYGEDRASVRSRHDLEWEMAPVAQTVARLWADDLGYIVIIRSKRSSNPRPEPVRQPHSGFYCTLDFGRNAELRISSSCSPTPELAARNIGGFRNEPCQSSETFVTTNSYGALTPVSGSPFPAGLGPVSVAMGPRATFAYVANRGSNDVTAYSIASNGALTPVPDSPFRARVKPASVAITGLMPLQSPYETKNTAR
jgi:hypothetical protein